MSTQAGRTSTQETNTKTSVIINISTPGSPTPICRIANSEEVLGDLTIRQLIERIVSPKSLFSVGVPMSQLEAESPAATAVAELLSAASSQVVLHGSANEEIRPVALDEPARSVARLHTGAQGTAFLDLNLEVRPVSDNTPPAGAERRRVALPEVVEAPAVTQPASAPPERQRQEAPPAPEPASTEGIMTIVAEVPTKKAEEGAPTWDRKEYLRKSDWLRAQFQPEVEALNFTGLFVGNLGFGIREEQPRRQVVLADPARITDILLRGNGYRRAGDHAKALICYQELVDMDASNADFRFLLGKTLVELGQYNSAVEAFARAKELGHDGAVKELEALRKSGQRARRPLGFLRFWKQ